MNFRSLVERADPAIAQQLHVEASLAATLPSEFYARALSAYASIPPSLYPRTLYDLILQQAIEQLDPARKGMSISVVVCMPPLQGTCVRSLREFVGIGNPPWKRDLDHSSAFWGLSRSQVLLLHVSVWPVFRVARSNFRFLLHSG